VLFFTHCQSFPNLCHHPLVVSIAILCPEWSDIKYTWMPSPIYQNMVNFLRWGVYSPTPNPQAGGPLLVGCLWLLIQYIRSDPPKLEGVSSIRNLRTRRAMVTRDPHNMEQITFTYKKNEKPKTHETKYRRWQCRVQADVWNPQLAKPRLVRDCCISNITDKEVGGVVMCLWTDAEDCEQKSI
jgi:hypothetical protein